MVAQKDQALRPCEAGISFSGRIHAPLKNTERNVHRAGNGSGVEEIFSTAGVNKDSPALHNGQGICGRQADEPFPCSLQQIVNGFPCHRLLPDSMPLE